VGSDAIICASAVIKAGVSIGEGAVVGMGAVVCHDITPGTVVFGVPASPRYSLDEYRNKQVMWETQV